MIFISSIEVSGTSDAGPFVGKLMFERGLQVITGRNGFGKTLAAKSIAWCLNLEAMFGQKDSDSSFFPEAVLEELNLPNANRTRVISSQATLTIERLDGQQLQLTRGITHDKNKIDIVRISGEQTTRLALLTGLGSMVEETTGFQRFLFEWLGWPIKRTTTYNGPDAFIYMENLAPLFYIEQEEGWTEIQARQIGRYGQQQIRELSVEYLLGAVGAVDQRVASQQANALDNALRASARGLAERASQAFLKQGWAVDWSGNGSVKEVEARWSGTTLRKALLRDAEIDLANQRSMAVERVVALRKTVTTDPIDAANMTAPSSASQLVIDLKQRRHGLNSDLGMLRAQHTDNDHLLESLSHRIRTATDVHRLKTTGVGRLAHLECPTCHRELDIDAFQLNDQSAPEVHAHIEALKRDRALTKHTLSALDTRMRVTEAEVTKIDGELHNAQRTLEDVSATVGPVREQIVQAASNLAAQERFIERLDTTVNDLDELQKAIDQWLVDAKTAHPQEDISSDIARRVSVFTGALGEYLLALGHSAALDKGVGTLRLDQGQYEPYLGSRRLRTLGSGSDPARLVGAYTLALAAASETLHGLHPGLVILDEPLQQNPDDTHVELLLNFLSKSLAKEAKFQTLVFTFLSDTEVSKLREGGTKVLAVGWNLLAPVPRPEAPPPQDELKPKLE